MAHKEYHIIKKIIKLRGYASKEGDFWDIHISDRNDTFLSNTRPQGKPINILYHGKMKDMPSEMKEKVFLRYENGDGYWFLEPDNPFEFCMGEDIERGFELSIELFTKALDTENVYVYEIKL